MSRREQFGREDTHGCAQARGRRNLLEPDRNERVAGGGEGVLGWSRRCRQAQTGGGLRAGRHEPQAPAVDSVCAEPPGKHRSIRPRAGSEALDTAAKILARTDKGGRPVVSGVRRQQERSRTVVESLNLVTANHDRSRSCAHHVPNLHRRRPGAREPHVQIDQAPAARPSLGVPDSHPSHLATHNELIAQAPQRRACPGVSQISTATVLACSRTGRMISSAAAFTGRRARSTINRYGRADTASSTLALGAVTSSRAKRR